MPARNIHKAIDTRHGYGRVAGLTHDDAYRWAFKVGLPLGYLANRGISKTQLEIKG